MKITAAHIFNSRVTSVISISLVIFLIGVTTTLMMLSGYLSNTVKENAVVSINLKDDLNDADVQKLQKIVDAKPYCKITEFVSKDSALARYVADGREDPTEFLGYNPLPNSIEMKLNATYANADSIPRIITELERMTEVKSVECQQTLIDSVDRILKKISAVCICLAVLLILISYALITNTVRLTIYAKRFLIHTMKLVGATKSFIRRPLLIQGALTGVLSAVIAMGILSAMVYWTFTKIVGAVFSEVVNMLLLSFLIMIVSGLLITIIATFISVTRYLKINVDEMYYI